MKAFSYSSYGLMSYLLKPPAESDVYDRLLSTSMLVGSHTVTLSFDDLTLVPVGIIVS